MNEMPGKGVILLHVIFYTIVMRKDRPEKERTESGGAKPDFGEKPTGGVV